MIDVPARVCLDLAIIIVVAHLAGVLFRRIGQPAVAGEIIAGIALGPSLLGVFPGNPSAWLFPLAVLPSLKVLAQLGAIFFMFIVGLEADLSLVRHRRVAVGGVSLTSIMVPFGLGIALASYLYDRYPPKVGGHDSLAFALFVGAAMSVTAFPVLARILSERRMLNSELGAFALGCAAVDDLAAWSLLAIVVGVVQASGAGSFIRMMAELVLFSVALWLFANKLLARLIGLRKGSVDYAFIVLVAGVLISAWVTDRIGLELIFGAFLFGAVIPKGQREVSAADVVHRLESVTLIILLPVFFVVAGLSVNIRAIGWSGLGALILIIVAAIAGKFGGATLAARFFGIRPRQSLALGVLLNTRGLTELVILTVGLSLGVLVPQLFTLFVVMAVVTTMLTGPLFRVVYPDEVLQADIARSRRMAVQGGAFTPLVVIGDDLSHARTRLALGQIFALPPGHVLGVRFLQKESSEHAYSGIAGDLVKVTAAMEELGEVAGNGAIEPIAQLTDDWKADLDALTTRSVVDVAIVTPEEFYELGQCDTPLACDLLAIDDGGIQGIEGVAILVGRDADGDAAIELGLRATFGGFALPGPDTETVLIPASRSEVALCHRVQHRVQASIHGRIGTQRGWSEAPPDAADTWALIVGTRPTQAGALPDLATRWPGPVWLVAAGHGPGQPSLEERLRRLDPIGRRSGQGTAEVT